MIIKMERIIDTEKPIYFIPGDRVQVRHDIENKPTMYVIEKVVKSIRTKENERENIFLGIKCRWYDKNQVLHEAIFSTKDLTHA